MILYLNKTGYHNRKYTALNRVSVESLSHKHDQEQEVTKKAEEDEKGIEEYYKYQDVGVPNNNKD